MLKRFAGTVSTRWIEVQVVVLVTMGDATGETGGMTWDDTARRHGATTQRDETSQRIDARRFYRGRREYRGMAGV
jgi:hypothetical protein